MSDKRNPKNKVIKDDDMLTKHFLQTAARKAFRKAAKETMKVMGYNVIARDGWVIKLYPDGNFERISPVQKVSFKVKK